MKKIYSLLTAMIVVTLSFAAGINLLADDTGQPDEPKLFTWTFNGAEGLSVSYAGEEAEYADGAYSIVNLSTYWENTYPVIIGSGSSNLTVVKVTMGDKEFTATNGQVMITPNDLVADDMTFTIVTEASSSGSKNAYIFIVDDVSHISSIRTVMNTEVGFFNSDNVFEYPATSSDDLVFYPATGSTIVKITAESFDGRTISTSTVMGGTMISVNALTPGQTYYITTTGADMTDVPDDAYVFNCPEGNVLEIIPPSTATVTYSNGRYVVRPIPTTAGYWFITIKSKDSNYQLLSVSNGSTTIEADNTQTISFNCTVYPAPAVFDVNFKDANYKYNGFEFEGPSGFYADYTFVNYEWRGGSVQIPARELANMGNVVLKVAAGNIELVNAVDESGREYTASNGTITIPVSNYVAFGYVQKFTVTTQEQQGEVISFTAELMSGDVYQATVNAGNTSYDFYEANPLTITTLNSQTVEVAANSIPFDVKVDGVSLDPETWEYTYGDAGKYVLAPGSPNYPQSNGRIQIYMKNVNIAKYNVTFGFTTEGTEGFINQLGIQEVGKGMQYFRQGEEEFDNAMSNGLLLEKGTGFELYYNTTDYIVNGATLNGANLSTNQPYQNAAVENDLAFMFDVKKVPGNTVNFDVTGDYNQLYVIDRNYAGESDSLSYYTLDKAQTAIEFAKSVEEIKITAKPGFEIPSSDYGTPGITVTYPQGSANVSETLNAGTYFPVEDGMKVEIIINALKEASQREFKFYSEADVLYFVAQNNTDWTYEDMNDVVWTAPAQDGEMGYYTVTNIGTTIHAIEVGVKQEYQADYTLGSITWIETNQTSYNYSGLPSGRVQITADRITGDATFNVVFKQDIPPVYITIEVSNPTCIYRIYNSNVTLTTFPAQYDLNDGTELIVELRDNCMLNGVTYNDESILGKDMTIDLSSVEEGGVVKVNVSSEKGDYSYTFSGPEGLSIKYNGIQAPFVDGLYTVDNVYANNFRNYPIFIEVASGYSNTVKLINVTDGENTWEYNPSLQQVVIPSTDLPAANTRFIVNTEVPDASETTRTITLTIDNMNVVQYGVYMGGSSAYWGFESTGEGTQGKAVLTITPNQYDIQIVTSKMIQSITTDVENTFVMPALPTTSLQLSLLHVVQGQTINLFTEGSETPVDQTITITGATVNSVSEGMAKVSVAYTVSENLVGQLVSVTVNGYNNTTFTPESVNGLVEVNIDVTSLLPGQSQVYAIVLSSGNAKAQTEVTITVPTVDEEDSIEISSDYTVNLADDMATISLTYAVSQSLVGEELTVTVNGETNSWITPNSLTGNKVDVNIDLDGLKDGIYPYTIEISKGAVSDSITMSISVNAVRSIFGDENGNVKVFTLDGVQVKNVDNLQPGIYIINGKKVLLNK